MSHSVPNKQDLAMVKIMVSHGELAHDFLGHRRSWRFDQHQVIPVPFWLTIVESQEEGHVGHRMRNAFVY
jgi:hypothetical protein